MIPPPEYVRIALTFSDETLGIMSFVTNDFQTVRRDPSDENIRVEISRTFPAVSGKTVFSWRRIEEDAIPRDRTFRNAWRDRGRIEVDMPAAREIHREHIRSARVPLLADLDVAYQRADEAGDAFEKRRVAAEKQRLRDLTADPDIDAAPTPQALKAVWKL